MSRTALLIRCNADEAETVRSMAREARGKKNTYVLSVAMRAAEIEDRLFSAGKPHQSLGGIRLQPTSASGPRAALPRAV